MPRKPSKVRYFPDKLCENCTLEFTPVRVWQKYCSRQCSTEAHWKRKIAEGPRDILDEPKVSAAQEAEWERRRSIRDSEHNKAYDYKEELDNMIKKSGVDAPQLKDILFKETKE